MPWIALHIVLPSLTCSHCLFQSIQNVYRTMSNIFLVFPQFSFGNGLMELTRVDMQVQILSAFGVDAYKNPFSMDVLGWMYISLFLQGFICFTLRLLLNKTLLRKVRYTWGSGTTDLKWLVKSFTLQLSHFCAFVYSSQTFILLEEERCSEL